MNPIDWLQDNIFYTDAKKKQINDAMRANAAKRSGGEPTAYATHSGMQYYDMADGRSVYQTPTGDIYDREGGQQIFIRDKTGESMTFDGAFSRTPTGADAYVGTNGVNIDKQKIYQGTQTWKVPDSTLNSDNGGNGGGGGNRNSERTNANGVVQKGTNMSKSFNDLLAETNTSGYRPFGSSQLPTTAGSPDSKVTPKTQQILAGIQAGKEADMGIEGYQAPASAQSSAKAGVLGGIRGGARTDRRIQGTSTAADGVFAGIQGGQKTDQGIEGYKKPGSTSRLDDALNDKEGINSYMSKFSDGDRQRAANRAFLDTKGSMEGLRAKEAVNGVVYAEQGHYIQGADPKGPAQKITRDQARSISRGETSAQALLKSYTQGLTEAGKESPAERQDPATTAQESVKAGFAAGAKTDFELNNSQGAPQVGVGPTVDLNDIPKDLSGAAGKKYLEDLDAGRLFK